mmetsp:Transcript_91384/g.255267  ORF Transcript_91384/g.255267 Transcript_91384/m.255267 type:complete len:299 (-) Transcript_91384:177-1073(-)
MHGELVRARLHETQEGAQRGREALAPIFDLHPRLASALLLEVLLDHHDGVAHGVLRGGWHGGHGALLHALALRLPAGVRLRADSALRGGGAGDHAGLVDGDVEALARLRDDGELVGPRLNEGLQRPKRMAEAVVPVVHPDMADAALLPQLRLDLEDGSAGKVLVGVLRRRGHLVALALAFREALRDALRGALREGFRGTLGGASLVGFHGTLPGGELHDEGLATRGHHGERVGPRLHELPHAPELRAEALLPALDLHRAGAALRLEAIPDLLDRGAGHDARRRGDTRSLGLGRHQQLL